MESSNRASKLGTIGDGRAQTLHSGLIPLKLQSHKKGDAVMTLVITLAWDTVTEESFRLDEVYSVFWEAFLTNLHVSLSQPVGCDPFGG